MPSVLRVTALIATFSILSKILGLVRQMVFANKLGVGGELDIYVAAFRIPDLVFNLLILGTLSVAFIPVFVSYLERDAREAPRIASTIFNLTFLTMTVLGLGGFILAKPLTSLLVPGFTVEAKQLTAELTKILMLSPLLFSLSSVLTSILHSHKKFLLAATAPLLYNLSIIAGVVFLYPDFGLRGIVWAVVAGAGLHFVFQLPQGIRLGLWPFRDLALDHPGVRKIAKLFLPRIFGIELGQISFLIATVLGSSLASGTLAAFYFAYDLETVPLGVFAISFAVAAFPTMAGYFSKQDLAGLKSFLSRTMVQILFLVIPISVLMLLLRAQITRLVLGAGENTKFDFAATSLVAQTLGIFVLSLFAQSLTPLLARAFYAMQNTIIPVISGLAAAFLNIALAVLLVRFDGAPVLALAFSAAAILHAAILFGMLHRRLGDLEDEFLLVRLIKILIASITMAIPTFITMYLVAPLVDMRTYLGVLSQTVVAVLVALPAYFLAGLAIKLPESRDALKILKNWFGKFSTNLFTDLRS